MADGKVCTVCKKAVRTRFAECADCGIVCHYSCGEKSKILVGSPLEMVCCDITDDNCDRVFNRIDSYKDNTTNIDIQSILDDIYSLKQFLKLKNTIICSQRETIDILKDSLHRAAADRDSFAACSQETISALKLALQLKEAHNQSIGAVTDRPRILKENTLSAVGTSVANGGKKPKQKKIVTTVSPIGDVSNTTERRTDTAVINTHLASVPDSLSINKNLKASLGELTMPGRRITGTLPSLDVGIKSAPSLDWYYVSRLNINTDSAGLIDYVRSNILKSDDDHVETVEMHRHIEDRTFKSFRVGVTAGGDVDLLNSNYWPTGIIVERSFRSSSRGGSALKTRGRYRPTKTRPPWGGPSDNRRSN